MLLSDSATPDSHRHRARAAGLQGANAVVGSTAGREDIINQQDFLAGEACSPASLMGQTNVFPSLFPGKLMLRDGASWLSQSPQQELCLQPLADQQSQFIGRNATSRQSINPLHGNRNHQIGLPRDYRLAMDLPEEFRQALNQSEISLLGARDRL